MSRNGEDEMGLSERRIRNAIKELQKNVKMGYYTDDMMWFIDLLKTWYAETYGYPIHGQ